MRWVQSIRQWAIFFLFGSEVAAEKNVGEHVASVSKTKRRWQLQGPQKLSAGFYFIYPYPELSLGSMVVQAIGELVETNPTAQLSRAFLTMTPNDHG